MNSATTTQIDKHECIVSTNKANSTNPNVNFILTTQIKQIQTLTQHQLHKLNKIQIQHQHLYKPKRKPSQTPQIKQTKYNKRVKKLGKNKFGRHVFQILVIRN